MGLVVTAYGGVAGQGYTALEVLSSSAVLKAKYVDPYLADRESVQPTSRPGETYNAMVHPFFPLSVRGILWYQGESNAWEGDIYQIMERYNWNIGGGCSAGRNFPIICPVGSVCLGD